MEDAGQLTLPLNGRVSWKRLSGARAREKYGPYAYARVTVCMTDRDVLERLRRSRDAGRLEKVRPRKGPSHQPISQWIVCRNQEAIELMLAVYPHMGARRQAKIREVSAQVERRPARSEKRPA